MKPSDLEVLPTERIEVSAKNRIRLILQNKKLLVEVYKLEQVINTVIQKTVTNQYTSMEQSEQLRQKYKQEQDEQMRTIVKLKKEIKTLKTNIADHKYDEIRNQENQVTYLKRELDKLMSERDTLQKKKQQKEQGLQFHKPINNLTASTLEEYKKTKAKNNELKYTIHQVEREVAKYHNIKELSKTAVPKAYDNPDYQFIKIENQMNGMRKEMRRIDQKWRVKIEALDKEYFSFKDIKKSKLTEIDNLEKEIKNYENRIASMRDELSIASDRQRINGVTISPQKRKEMQDLLEDEKKRLKRLSPKNVGKAKHEKGNKNSQITKKDKQQLKLIPQAKEQIVQDSIKPTVQIAVQSQQIKKEQIINQPIKENESNKGKGKMLQSVGVGTSFYYAD